AHIGVFYPLSSNGTGAASYTNYFSYHIFSGLSRSERRVAFAGIGTIIKDSLTGLQASGIFNYAGKSARGAQVAGILNTTGAIRGFQGAGIANIVQGNSFGFQGAGITNIVRGNSFGFQGAGITNVVRGNSRGVQVAGVLNLSGRDTLFETGSMEKSSDNITQIGGLINASARAVTQIGGLLNVSSKSAVQISGFMNKSDSVTTQITGFLNIARRVKGVQVSGFINIADSSDYPIGVINLVKKGEKSLGITTDENQTTVLAFRSGGRVLYGILGLGYNLKSKQELYALEWGLGAHLRVNGRFRLHPEIAFTALSDFKEGKYYKSSLRALAAWKVLGNMEVFAGPTFNAIKYTKGKGEDLNEHYLWSRQRNDWFRGLTFGLMGGVQFRL
ncbi:MAG: hypothetical protein H7Y03_13525, partial [Chitinophagaceae bacterium]|nr:hypothetical protein [Chitinophagaceae bacterium]